ncbi:ACS family hexuronate transporter-like MFS transporter [Povalibacter uvarum]|uniref:ACS family hexuronate transporter-like MFS transporter n=1 Tax=Povalibacter uvarum TaxID=732238 RepID=A0A841HFF0_9GAMM|nr:MFS transporter [Povalibacter uvarum]MBB6091304.1 ACS family hexuronate transporter-like MFS transporter [Povalibacter uvarum]
MQEPLTAASPSEATHSGRLRWAILALLFAATVLNYVDRQTLSILASQVQKDLGIDDAGYARIVQYFLIAYAISYIGAGWVTDKLGAKWTLALFLGWWSLANMATGWVRNAAQLGFARLMLGIGEPGVYTAGPKAVAEHFPSEQRGFAIGIYTAGAMVGATIAPPLIAFLALQYGWRAAFIITGAAGFVWLAIWLVVYRSPDGAEPARTKEPIRWGPILRDRSVWGLATARLIADPVWYFYLFWFPKYLTDERGMGLIQVASLAWIVYLAADVGSIGGGWFSGRLIRSGIAPQRSRIIAMACAAALAPFGMAIALNLHIGPTLAIAALVAFAHLVFQINIGALVVDRYPMSHVATVFGLIAAGSALGGFASTHVVGQLASTGNYDRVFLLMGALHPVAWFIAWISTRSRQ